MNEPAMDAVLQASSLHVLLMVVSRVLTRSGFGDVQILDRRHHRQKSRLGGCELLCQTNVGMVTLKTIVKVINDSVRIRMLDELAGAVSRTESDFGLLVTPHHLNRTARRQQASYPRSRIEILDGKALTSLLAKYDVGVRPSGEPDYAFFAELEAQSDLVIDFLKCQRP